MRLTLAIALGIALGVALVPGIFWLVNTSWRMVPWKRAFPILVCLGALVGGSVAYVTWVRTHPHYACTPAELPHICTLEEFQASRARFPVR